MFEANIARSPKRLRLFVFLCAAALAGVLFGTLIYCNLSSDRLAALDLSRDTFIEQRLDMGTASLLSKLFFTNALFLLTVYILGSCAAGAPFSVLVLVYRATGFGTACACILQQSGSGGLIRLGMLIFPDAAVSLLVLILAVRESVTMSGIVLRSLISAGPAKDLREITKLYSVKLLILLSVSGIGALFTSLTTYFYINYFQR